MCLAIPGQIVAFCDPERFLAKVDVSGVRRNVNVSLLSSGPDAVEVGDWILIHVGFGLSKIDEAQAQATLQALTELGEAFDQELEDLETSRV